MANPLIGLLFHWLGGLASASFYVPYKGVRRWSWEIFWLTGGFFSWIIGPWFFAALQTQDLIGVLSATPGRTLFWCYFFGALWGFGGLTFGLAIRYLGMSLGMAVALGLTTTFGTLVPPLFAGDFIQTLFSSSSGLFVCVGIIITLAGIYIVANAGRKKEQELSPEERTVAVAEFNLRKGLGVAVFSGIMSSCFAYGLAAGQPIRDLTLEAGTGVLWQGLPVLCVVLAGGFTTNFIWCSYLILKNGTMAEWFGKAGDASVPAAEHTAEAPGAETVSAHGASQAVAGIRPPLLRNFLLCAAAGLTWYFQFFFYTMGESQMGRFAFSSWTLHMASIIIFSTLWGFGFGEWRASSARTKRMVWIGIGTLVLATIVIGVGNYLDR